MKSQKHNDGELAELKVQIEAPLIEDLKKMSNISGLDVNELVTIALKRFKSSHADYLGIDLDYP